MDVWDLYFSAVCSIRFHPRNEIADPEWEIEKAARFADLMLYEREKRCQLQQQLSEAESQPEDQSSEEL